MTQEPETCRVDAQSAKPSSNDGSKSDTLSGSRPSSLDSLLQALERQTKTLERQTEALEQLNESIQGLLAQTAVLIEMTLSKDADDDGEEVYMDGTKVKVT